MAAVVPDTVTRAHMGEFTLTIYDLPATTDDTNTIDTGIEGIVSAMACQADTAGTAAATGVGVSFVASTTVITVHVGEANSAMTIWVLSRS